MSKKSSTIVRKAIRNKVTKAEASAEMQTVLSEIESLLQEVRGLGAGEETSPSGQEATMELTEPVDDDAAGDWEPGDADDNNDEVETTRNVGKRRVRREEEEEEDENFHNMEGPPPNENVGKRRIRREEEDDEPDGDESPKAVVKRKVKRAIITGDPDASTASSEAEDRIDDIPEYDEENVDEIAKTIGKSIIRMAQNRVRRTAQKSMGTGRRAEMADYNDEMQLQSAYAVAEVAKQVRGLTRVVTDILDGLGVAKQLDAPARSRREPVQTSDQGLVVKELVSALKSAGLSMEEGKTRSNGDEVHKDMGSIVSGLAQMAGDAWYGGAR